MRRIAFTLMGASLLLALVLAVDAVPFLRGGFGWQWPYVPVPVLRLLPLAGGGIVYMAGAWWLMHRAGNRTLLGWSLIFAVVLPVLALLARVDHVQYELFMRTASGLTTGPHLAAALIDWSDPAWVDWPQTMAPLAERSRHVALSGPGLPLWYALLNQALGQTPALAQALQAELLPYQCMNYEMLAFSPAQWASAWFGMLMPVWAALAVFPLYAVTRRLSGAGIARVAVSWWPLIPALVMFTPTWNTLYPLLALVAFWLLVHGLDATGGAGWFIASGLMCGLLIFANFSAVPLLALLGFYTLVHCWHTDRGRWWRPVSVGAWFGLGLLLPWLVYWLASGLTPLDLLSYAMAGHLGLERAYLPWLWLHFWEWALLTGLPLVALWLMGAARLRPLALALALCMALLLLSGTARGETGRVWLFFAPFVLIAAADMLGRVSEAREQGRAWLAVVVGQVALLMVLIGTWDVISTADMTPPPVPPGAVGADRPVQAAFDGAFTLTGWDAQASDNQVALLLDWQVQQSMTTPYWFAALLIAPDGSLPQPPVVWQALDTRYPTTCWQPGEVVGDAVTLPLPAEAMPGDWWISLSVFASEHDPEQRLSVQLPDGTLDNQLGLGPVTVR